MFKKLLRFLVSPCPISLWWLPLTLCVTGCVLSLLWCRNTPQDLLLYTQSLSGIYTDWHPPILAATWRLLRFVLDGFGITNTDTTVMNFISHSLLWCGLFLILHSGKKFWGDFSEKPVWIVCVVLICLLIVWLDTFAIFYDPLKERLLLGCYFISLGCLLNMPVNKVGRIFVGFIVLLFLFYGTAVRHNAIFSLLPLLFYLVWSFLPVNPPNQKYPYKRILTIIVFGGIFWGVFLATNHYLTYHILHSYRLYPLHERMYGDIFLLNYYAPKHYKNPPNTFGNNFDALTSDIFYEHYQQRLIHLSKAFKSIDAALGKKYHFTSEFVSVVADEKKVETEESYVTPGRKLLKNVPYDVPYLVLTDSEVRKQYPQDYALLRNAWIDRIKQNPLMYAAIKVKIWLKFMVYAEPKLFFISGGIFSGLMLLTVMVTMCLLTFSPSALQPNVFPSLMLAWSAVLLALPLIIFLPDDVIRYLYWFYASSFISIVLLCANSLLFAEIMQSVQRYFKRRLGDES